LLSAAGRGRKREKRGKENSRDYASFLAIVRKGEKGGKKKRREYFAVTGHNIIHSVFEEKEEKRRGKKKKGGGRARCFRHSRPSHAEKEGGERGEIEGKGEEKSRRTVFVFSFFFSGRRGGEPSNLTLQSPCQARFGKKLRRKEETAGNTHRFGLRSFAGRFKFAPRGNKRIAISRLLACGTWRRRLRRTGEKGKRRGGEKRKKSPAHAVAAKFACADRVSSRSKRQEEGGRGGGGKKRERKKHVGHIPSVSSASSFAEG